jgi:hypothetical protein
MRRYWLDGVLEEIRHRARGITSTIERYRDLRLESVGVYSVLDIVEAAGGFALAPASSTIPCSQEVRRLAASANAMSNDVFS